MLSGIPVIEFPWLQSTKLVNVPRPRTRKRHLIRRYQHRLREARERQKREPYAVMCGGFIMANAPAIVEFRTLLSAKHT